MFEASPSRRVGAAVLVGVLAGAPLAAQAQIYKCTQANGSVGYQSTPCPSGTKPAGHPTAAQLNAGQAAAPRDNKPYDDPYASSVDSRPHSQAPAVQAPASPFAPAQPAAATQNTSSLVADVQARNRRENQQQAYQEAHKNDRTAANAAACASAQHNLGVLKEERPVYSYDSKGNRVFVEDKDRAGTIAQTQQAVAANCK